MDYRETCWSNSTIVIEAMEVSSDLMIADPRHPNEDKMESNPQTANVRVSKMSVLSLDHQNFHVPRAFDSNDGPPFVNFPRGYLKTQNPVDILALKSVLIRRRITATHGFQLDSNACSFLTGLWDGVEKDTIE